MSASAPHARRKLDRTTRPLTRRFFARNAVAVSRSLLGMVLVHEAPEGTVAGRIVEVEAYRGPADRAAHSYGGRRTARNEVMYGAAGHAYVYFIYGMHYCINVVVATVDVPEAVLLRALEPLRGLDLMRSRRGLSRTAPAHLLCRGPGNVCRAMGIDRSYNGVDLVSGTVRLENGPRVPPSRLVRSPRIGVAYAGSHAALPWRLYEKGNPSVSARTASASRTKARRRSLR
jgi:DNA-3-methyladenine glycosylase